MSDMTGVAGAPGVIGAAGVAGAAAGTSEVRADKTPGKLAFFLRSSVPDFVICAIVSVALALTVSFAFESAPGLRGNVAVVLALCAPVLVALFVGAWSKKFIALSAALSVAYAVAVVAVAAAVTAQSVPIFDNWTVNDVAENLVPFAIICMVCPAATYLLSRRRLGVIILALACVFASAFVQFMYRDWAGAGGTAVFVVLLFAVCACFIFQYYRESLAKVTHMGRATFARALGYAALISGVCVALAVLIFVTLVAPLNLTTPEVKPFEDYYSRPVVEYSGVYQRQNVENPDILSDKTNDEEDNTQEDTEGGQDNTDATEDAPGGAIGALVNQVQSFDLQDWNQQFMSINYTHVAYWFVALVLLVCLLLVAVYLLQKNRWRLRLARFEQMSAPERVVATYNYLCRGLGKLGLTRPPNATPMEFALATRAQMAPFCKNTGGVDFLALTLIWQRAAFDTGRLTEDDWQHMRTFYVNFLPNSKDYLGKYRWLLYFWRL
jgi:hypothetical protein